MGIRAHLPVWSAKISGWLGYRGYTRGFAQGLHQYGWLQSQKRGREREREERIVLNKRYLRKAPLYQCRNFAEGHDMEVFHCFIQTQSAESTPCTSAKISLGDVIFSWISSADPTHRMPMMQPHQPPGCICSFGEPDHILQVRCP